MKKISILFSFVIISLNCVAQRTKLQTTTISKQMNTTIAVLLFDEFETLDVFGPVEIFGTLPDLYTLKLYSLHGGLIKNNHGVSVLTEKLANAADFADIFLIPGGLGTRLEVENKVLIDEITKISNVSKYVLTVCTGSALLAKTGLLDGRKATSNKNAFGWVMTNGENVKWNKKVRWTVDEKYYTSSGVSAGMDMALGFIEDRHGIDSARKVATAIEYNWIQDKNNDTFTAH